MRSFIFAVALLTLNFPAFADNTFEFCKENKFMDGYDICENLENDFTSNDYSGTCTYSKESSSYLGAGQWRVTYSGQCTDDSQTTPLSDVTIRGNALCIQSDDYWNWDDGMGFEFDEEFSAYNGETSGYACFCKRTGPGIESDWEYVWSDDIEGNCNAESCSELCAESIGNSDYSYLLDSLCNLGTLVHLYQNDGTNAENGTITMPTTSYLPIPTRPGYRFNGYYDAPTGGNQYIYYDGSSYNDWDKTTDEDYLYAQWVPDLIVNLYQNDGTETINATIIVNNGFVTPLTASDGTALSVPTRSGYMFSGYYDAPTGGNQYYTANMSHASANIIWRSDTAKPLYAQWVPALTVNLYKNDGTDSIITTITVNQGFSVPNAASDGTALTIPTRPGYRFNGYYDAPTGGNQYYDYKMVGKKRWDKDTNAPLYAQWIKTFSLTTKPTQYFGFSMSAKGNFTVDCGDGGLLYGSGVSGNTITRTNTTEENYLCLWDDYIAHTVQFNGVATLYNTSNAAIRFYTNAANAALIDSIDGSLGAVFPTIYTTSTSGIPRFIGTFAYATGLTSLPDGLFNGIYGAASSMFSETFRSCTGLTSLPSDLFDGIYGSASSMFSYTFLGCTGLTSLPAGLFDGISGITTSMFAYTFADCVELKSIPANLFSNISLTKNSSFNNCFSGDTKLDTFYYENGSTSNFIPPNFFGNSSGVPNMKDVFADTAIATSCPSGYGQYITGYEEYFGDYKSCAPISENVFAVSLYQNYDNNDNTVVTTVNASNGTVLPLYNTNNQPLTVPIRPGYIFIGYYDSREGGTKYYDSRMNAIENCNNENNSLYAQWEQEKFSLTTKETDVFKFSISASGTFYVDCGDGGFLTAALSSSVSDNTINLGLNNATYVCNWPSVTTHTVRFGGLATGYKYSNTIYNNYEATISFYNSGVANAELITSVSGSLGEIFPVLETVAKSAKKTPAFYRTFARSANLTTVSANLFSGLTGVPSVYMFYQTFYGATSLHTFDYGNGQTSNFIPANFFGNISSAPDVDNFMNDVFADTAIATSCPSGYGQYITGFQKYFGDYKSCAPISGNVFTVSLYQNYDSNDNTVVTTVNAVSNLALPVYDSNNQILNIPEREGYVFAGYYDARNGGKMYYDDSMNPVESNWDKASNANLYAHWIQNGFVITTVSTNEFKFMLSAAGTFTVDCGEGGTLSGAKPYNGATKIGVGVSGNTITRSVQSSEETDYYHCTWSSTTNHTVVFSGRATGYYSVPWCKEYNENGSCRISNSSLRAVINFIDNKLSSISGSLGSVFPTLNDGSPDLSKQPRFYRTFYGNKYLHSVPQNLFTGVFGSAENMFASTFSGCSGLTSLPDELFDGISGAAEGMFSSTFNGCSGLTSLPDGLFNGISGAADYMFNGTFKDCSRLTSLPDGLFDGISGAANKMFYGTFYGCSGLTSLPDGLFNGISSAADYMFSKTFYNCSRLTSLPDGLFNGISGAADYMFEGTFYNCSRLTSLPDGLFDGISGAANNMFENTFYGCTGLTSLPSDLFNGISGAADYMFSQTFYGCSGLTTLPDGLFNGISGAANYMFNYTFRDCRGLTSLPSDLFNGISGAANNMFYGTFNNCSGLTSLPSDLFNGISDAAYNMFNSTFSNCTGLTSLPDGLFNGISGAASSMFNETFSYCRGLTSLPSNLFNGISGAASSMFNETFYGCSGLTSLPAGLFNGISGAAYNMFSKTFAYCSKLESIPADLFSGLSGEYSGTMFEETFSVNSSLSKFDYGNNKTSSYVPKNFFGSLTRSASNTNIFKNMFSSSTGVAEFCPNGMFKYTENPYDALQNNKVSCDYCPTDYSSLIIDNDTIYRCYNNTDERFGCPATDSFGGTYYSGRAYYAGEGVPDSTDECIYNYTVTLDGTEGVQTSLALTTYNKNTTERTLPDSNIMKKAGAIFNGWVDGNGNTATEIPADARGPLTYTAQWNECPNNSFCDGSSNTPTSCSTATNGVYTLSDSGSTSINDCYRNCVAGTDVPNATAATGSVHYSADGEIANCAPANANSCATGYEYQPEYVKPDNPSVYASGHSCLSKDGTRSEGDVSSLEAGEWIVYWDEGDVIGSLKGITSCNDVSGVKYETTVSGDTFDGTETGQYCWCKPTEWNGKSVHGMWGLRHDDIGSCSTLCASACAAQFRENSAFRDTMYNSMSESSPASCSLKTYTITYNGVDGAINNNPTEYTYESETIVLSDPSKDGYTFDGWTMGGEDITQIENHSTGDKTLTANWTLNTYTITYNDGENTYTAEYNVEMESVQLATPTDKPGYTFDGWYTTDDYQSGTKIDSINTSAPANLTLYAKWTKSCADNQVLVNGVCSNKFILTTTATNSFKIIFQSSGTFYIDCGDDGTLYEKDTVLSVNIFNRETTALKDYYCKYPSSAERTITLAGKATGYISDPQCKSYVTNGMYPEGKCNVINTPKPAVIFESKITSIQGSLGAIFPTIGDGSDLSKQPRFVRTFANNKQLTALPAELFDGIHGVAAEYMFFNTFRGCTGLTSVPEGLFSGISVISNGTFFDTFMDATNLTVIPANLFSGMSGTVDDDTFWSTFENPSLNAFDYGNAITTNYIPKDFFGTTTCTRSSCPAFYGTQIATVCEDGMFTYKTYGDKVSCDSCPIDYTSQSGDNDTIYRCYNNMNERFGCPATDSFGGTYYSGRAYYAGEDVPDNTDACLYEYTITYELDGGTNNENNPASYTAESETITLQAPSVNKPNASFGGWYDNAGFTGDAITTIDTSSKANITLYAKWTCNDGYEEQIVIPDFPDVNVVPSNYQYRTGSSVNNIDDDLEVGEWKVKWATDNTNDSMKGSAICTNSIFVNVTYDHPAYKTYSDGYTTGPYCWCKAIKFNEQTLYSNWLQDINSYSSYNNCLNGCASSCAANVVTNDVFRSAIFGGVTGSNSVQCTPKTYKITYANVDGATNNNPTGYNYESETITLQDPTDKPGYTFAGWTMNGEPVTQIAHNSTGDKTITADWSPIEYTITYELDGGENAQANPSTYTIESENITLATPTKDHAGFKGWCIDLTDDTTCSMAPVIERGSTGNQTFYAKWECDDGYEEKAWNLATVIGDVAGASHANIVNDNVFREFDASYGKSYYGITEKNTWAVNYENNGILVGQARCSTRAGAQDTWTNGTYNGEGNIVSSLTEENGTGSYCYCNVTGYRANNNSDLQRLASSWVFVYNWERHNLCVSNCALSCSDKMQGNYTANLAFREAMFNAVEPVPSQCVPKTYTITYENVSGATNNNPTGYNYESETINLSNPTKDGYTFDRWTDENGSLVTQIAHNSTGDKTLTANWTAITYNITYETRIKLGNDWLWLDVQTPENTPYFYNIGEEVVLPKITAENYTFGGWYDNEDFEGDAITTIPAGSMNDKTFYAKWTHVTCDAGYYLAHDGVTCDPCTEDSYCPGGTYALYTDVDQGNRHCPEIQNPYGAYNINYYRSDVDVPSTEDTCMVNVYFSGEQDLFAGLMDVSPYYDATLPLNINSASYNVECRYNQQTELYDICRIWFLACKKGYYVPTLPESIDAYDTSTWHNINDLAGICVPAEQNHYTKSDRPLPEEANEWIAETEQSITELESQIAELEQMDENEILPENNKTVAEYLSELRSVLEETQLMLRMQNAEILMFQTAGGSVINFTEEDNSNIWYYDYVYPLGWGTPQESKETLEDQYGECPPEYPNSAAGSWTINQCYATVTFDANNDTNIQTETYYYSDEFADGYVVTLPEPEKPAGLSFGGWFDEEGHAISGPTVVLQGNKDFTAVWEVNIYTISYELGGGTNNPNNPSTYTIESENITLSAPEKDGYMFVGWYDNEQFTGDAITTIPTGSTGDKTLYAKWEENCSSNMWWHIGEGRMCLSATRGKNTGNPVLVVQIDGVPYYGMMTPVEDADLPISKCEAYHLKMNVNGTVYSVHDKTVNANSDNMAQCAGACPLYYNTYEELPLDKTPDDLGRCDTVVATNTGTYCSYNKGWHCYHSGGSSD